MSEKKLRSFIYLLTNHVISLIVANEKVSELEAIKRFYHSHTYHILEMEQSKYWWLSAEALYDEYIAEQA
ncbi:MAG: hypothetical protein LBI41_04455 [Lactobacillales bacterium]|jgi:hypothetical protein|nr:hypothetical protein [Lactobacillales bacterium]